MDAPDTRLAPVGTALPGPAVVSYVLRSAAKVLVRHPDATSVAR